MNTTEMYMLKAIAEGQQVDWSFQIRQHIVKSHVLKGSKLPYGCHLTNIFRDKGIVLDNEWKVEVDAKDGAIDTRVFGSMQIGRDPYDQLLRTLVTLLLIWMPTPFQYMM